MDPRALNAIKVGVICGIALIFCSYLAYGIMEAVFAEMNRPMQPVPADGPTPTPIGNDSGAILALILLYVMLTLGSMLILGAGGALYAWMSRGSPGTIRETIRWSSITGIFSYVAYFVFCIAILIIGAIASLIISGDLSGVSSGAIPGIATTFICCFPYTVIILALAVMSAAIGGYGYAALILKQS